MRRQLRSELLKLRTTRTTWGLLAGELALVLLAVLIQALVTKVPDLSGSNNERNLLGSGTAATLFAGLVGILAVTNEFRFGTIRPTLVFEPRRRVVVGAKLVASGLTGLVFGGAGAALTYALALPILSARGVHVTLGDRTLVLIAVGTVLGSALWGMLGAAVGALVRHQVGAVVGILAWSFVVESLLLAFVPKVGRLLPGQAGNALAGAAGDKLLSAGWGGTVLVAWALALAVAGVVRTDRSDVG